jgi:outer membrane protein assembly factor BamB
MSQETIFVRRPTATPAGEVRAPTFDLGRPVSRLIAADLDGDGRTEVLFGCDDGKLYALGERDGKPRLLWSVALGRRVGEPILADLDGDGRPEILVAAEDGKLYCLKG